MKGSIENLQVAIYFVQIYITWYHFCFENNCYGKLRSESEYP